MKKFMLTVVAVAAFTIPALADGTDVKYIDGCEVKPIQNSNAWQLSDASCVFDGFNEYAAYEGHQDKDKESDKN